VFLGIIDILQNYRLAKKIEHALKATIHDGVRLALNKFFLEKGEWLNSSFVNYIGFDIGSPSCFLLPAFPKLHGKSGLPKNFIVLIKMDKLFVIPCQKFVRSGVLILSNLENTFVVKLNL
jgi:hypothetical protein